jgi:hypothetical protein
MESLIVKVNEIEVRIQLEKDESISLHAVDVLSSVGLDKLTKDKRVKKLYKYLCACQYKKACRYVAYIQDISIKNAKELLVRYFLVLLGMHITHSSSQKQKESMLLFNSSFINGLLSTDYSNRTIIAMVNDEGYHIEYFIVKNENDEIGLGLNNQLIACPF